MNVYVVLVKARPAIEGQEDKPEHVEGGKQRRQQAEGIKNGAARLALKCGEEDGILGEETCKEGNAGDGECGHQHGPVRPADLLAQTAHAAHVLLAAHGVNHAACCKEEKRLEERMGHQVENARGECANAAREKHVAQLADRRVRENFLNIRLHQADGRRKKRRRAAYDSDDKHGGRRVREENVRARNDIYARSHHRRPRESKR